ncbi:MAG: YdcF family protein [Alphaproteobacteria bacterium]|nr:YdcF family protein [Alphaproteobacteria bacterium]
MIGFALIVAFLLTIFPVGIWARQHMENRFAVKPDLPEKIDGIIVLGGAVNPRLSEEYGLLNVVGNIERLIEFVNLLEAYPEAKGVFSGGSASLVHQHYKEGDWAEVYFEMRGVDPARLVLERESRNTYENAVNSKSLVMPKEGESWVLVTSASHMPRAVGVFRKQGWDIIPYPVDHSFGKAIGIYFEVNFAKSANYLYSSLYEMIGLVAYYFTGKTSELYPAPKTGVASE